MIRYDIDEYDVRSNESNTRLELVADSNTESKLFGQYRNSGFILIDVADLYSADESTLLNPSALLTRIGESCFDEIRVIKGLTNYLSIWNEDVLGDFFWRLRSMLNSQKSNVVFVMRESLYRPGPFHNPKYENSMHVVFLESSFQEGSDACVARYTILDSGYGMDCCIFDSYKDLVRELCRADQDREHKWAVSNRGKRPKGLVGSIQWPDSYAEIVASDLKLKNPLPEEAAESLLKRSRQSGVSIQNYIEKETRLNRGTTTERALKRLVELESDPLFGLYVEYVSQVMPSDTYLSHALSTYDGSDSILHHYFVNATMEVLSHNERVSYSEERNIAFNLLKDESEELIEEFVQKSRDRPDSILWLNCGTKYEKAELIRRLFSSDVSGGIPSDISRNYRELDPYLGLSYKYGDDGVTDYFRRYRANKLTNQLPREFIELVNSTEYPWRIRSRRDALGEYRNVSNVALLMVDGLGAEYTPLLDSRLRERGMDIEREDVVRAELPTSTCFNDIDWPIKSEDIKSLDNTAHDGAVKHERTTTEENICKSLDIVSKEVVSRVVTMLKRDNYDKVIITADHGLTRLAVLAHENSCDEVIDGDYGQAEDWRYTPKPDRTPLPDGVMSTLNHKFDKEYWVVTNYNKLRKSGSKKYETHGGATLEECLVPFIVVRGFKDDYDVESAEVSTEVSSGDEPQLVERDLFEGF